jgi:hypothetical protein
MTGKNVLFNKRLTTLLTFELGITCVSSQVIILESDEEVQISAND